MEPRDLSVGKELGEVGLPGKAPRKTEKVEDSEK